MSALAVAVLLAVKHVPVHPALVNRTGVTSSATTHSASCSRGQRHQLGGDRGGGAGRGGHEMDVAGDLGPAGVVALLADRGGGVTGVPGPLGARRSVLVRDVAQVLQAFT